MSTEQGPRNQRKGKKVRVEFKRNRAKPARKKSWPSSDEAGSQDAESAASESIMAKGDMSRKRTVFLPDEPSDTQPGWRTGTVVAMRGLYADVNDGQQVWPCVIRRVLRTRLIGERHPVVAGDRVWFSVETSGGQIPKEGVIERVAQRHGALRRRSGKRIHVLAVNVDQAVIVSAAADPSPKPELIDRYIVSAHAGDIEPVICMNKMDLDQGVGAMLCARYRTLGYRVLGTSAINGAGIPALRDCLAGLSSVVTGQSGVGKSSLLNALQPGLRLPTAEVADHNKKGKHTTTTAELLELEVGGYVVDTPGIRSFDISTVPSHELEAYFVEFVEHVPHCKYADCTHIHESHCAVKAALDQGAILRDRYESYVHMFTEPA